VKLVACYPPHPVPAEAFDPLRAAVPGLEVVHLPFVEGVDVRSKRTRGTYDAALDEVPVPAELADALADADVVLGLDLPQRLRTLAPKLRWVHAIGAGTGYLFTYDLPDGVVITSAAGVSAPAIAEFVLGRLLAEWKGFDRLAEIQRAHAWDTAGGRGRTFAGSTVVVVGFGAIGQAVARLAGGCGARVLGVRRTPAPSPLAERVVAPGELHAVLGEADAVVVAAPATADTEALFDARALAALRPGAVLVNVARGTLVDEGALVAALRSGHLRRAILDVTRVEPLPADSPLWDEPGVVLSPHSSASMDRYLDDLVALVADNLGRWSRGEPLRNLVDPERGY
jgi:phosphoglycerate dehydrogenase-like enzyme